MINKTWTLMLLLLLSSSLVGCKNVLESHRLSFKDNKVISTTTISEKYGLPFSGNFPLDIKELNYGQINLFPKTDKDNFKVEVEANFEVFNNDIWKGFGPIFLLPNRDPFPSWLNAPNLIKINIPTFTNSFELFLLVNVTDKIYIGLDIEIKSLNESFPEGLKISQDVKLNKEQKKPFASIFAYGPLRDSEDQIIKDSGITILSSFSKSRMSE